MESFMRLAMAQIGFFSARKPSVVQNLPLDILEHIFLLANANDFTHVQPNQYASPVVLCHVCKWWHQIALSSPRLWSKLNLKIIIYRARDRELLLERFINANLVVFLE